MSNHSGSHLLNSLLVMLERESYFAEIGPDKTTEFVAHVVGLARRHDGNPGEVLDGIGARLGICYQCCRRSDDLVYGACVSCRRR
jgi:hypothetical protein